MILDQVFMVVFICFKPYEVNYHQKMVARYESLQDARIGIWAKRQEDGTCSGDIYVYDENSSEYMRPLSKKDEEKLPDRIIPVK